MKATLDPTAAYREARGRISDLVADLPDHLAAEPVPATPEWRVQDVLAHVVGVSADIVNGNLEGVATDPWTTKQVADRRHRTVAELVAEWDENGPTVEAMIPSFPDLPRSMLLGDVTTHEHDLRGALGSPGARDSDALALGFAGISGGLEGVRLETDAGTFVRGDEPITTVRASRFELFRALTGRRSREQIAAYDWDGEPKPELVVASLFTPRPTPLEE